MSNNEHQVNRAAIGVHGVVMRDESRRRGVEVNVGVTPRDIRSFIKLSLSLRFQERSLRYIKAWILRRGHSYASVPKAEIMQYLHVEHGIHSVLEVNFLDLVDKIHLCIYCLQNGVPLRRLYRPSALNDWFCLLQPKD